MNYFSTLIGIFLCFTVVVCSAGARAKSVEDFLKLLEYDQLPLHEMQELSEGSFDRVKTLLASPEIYSKSLERAIMSDRPCCLQNGWSGRSNIGMDWMLPGDLIEEVKVERTETEVLRIFTRYGYLEFYVLDRCDGGWIGVLGSSWSQQSRTFFFSPVGGGLDTVSWQELGLTSVFDNDTLLEHKRFTDNENFEQKLVQWDKGVFRSFINGWNQPRWSDKKPDFTVDFIWNGSVFELNKAPAAQ